MHELKIAEDLSTIVIEAADREKLTRVIRVNIVCGQLVSLVPEIFDFAFREAVKESVAKGAELVIETIPVKLRCGSCGNDFILGSSFFSCSFCNSSDIEIIQGKELFVKSIEGE